MGTTRRRNAITGALLATVLIAGCASPAVSPDTPAPTPAPAPTGPESPATPPRLPALDDLVITPGGIGSLRVGRPVSETDMLVFDPDFCGPGDGEESGDDDDGTAVEYGRWVPNYPSARGLPFSAAVDDGIVTVIEVRNDILATAEGVRIGSSLEELNTAYPSLTPGLEGSISKSLLLATADGDIVFEVAIPSYYDGYPPNTVVDIRIWPPGQHDLKLVAATDDVVGGCL